MRPITEEEDMPKIAKQHATHVETMAGFEGRYEDLDGYTIGFEAYTQDADPGPLFQGLPGDRCQCPHWGVVLTGTLVYNYADGSQDVIQAGEAYYAPPGHLPVFAAGTEIAEFSPSEQLSATMEVVAKNVLAAGQA
jgi:hypothetical protein